MHLPRFAFIAAFGITVLGTTSLRSQDISIGTPLFPLAPLGSPPVLSKAPPIDFPDELRSLGGIGYVLGRVYVGSKGWYVDATGTHVPFEKVVKETGGAWKFSPAPKEGEAFGEMWLPIIFNPRSASVKGPEATPRLLQPTAVILPNSYLSKMGGPPVVHVRVEVDATGHVTGVSPIEVIDGRLATILRYELAEWNFAPARHEGNAVAGNAELWVRLTPGTSRYALHTAPIPAADATRSAAATLVIAADDRKRSAPATPSTVSIECTVDTEGKPHDPKIVQPGDAQADVAALAVIGDWRFTPALKDGQPVEEKLTVQVPLLSVIRATAAQRRPAVVAKTTMPTPIAQMPPGYPLAMRASGIEGEVTIDFIVDVDGSVKNAVVAKSNNPGFEEAALEAVRKWKFKPGTRDGKPAAVHMQVPIILKINDTSGRMESRDLMQASRPDPEMMKKLPPEYRYDTPPRFVDLARVVYPYEMLKQGIRGKARVAFVVDRRGTVALVEVAEASRPEFGMALAAAVEASRFEPALREGQPTQALMRRDQDFDFSSSNSLLLEAEDRLVSLEKKKPEKIVAADKLDQKLKPLVRRSPEFPLRLLKRTEEGSAIVEFLIDEDGKPQLARIVSASEAEFGYAAVQAITTWRFEPPKAGGKAVVVRTQQAFQFKASGDRTTVRPAAK